MNPGAWGFHPKSEKKGDGIVKYFILFLVALILGLSQPADALDYAVCKALRTRIEFHLKCAETAGINLNISIAESLKAISYLLLYQIHECQNATSEKPVILPPVSTTYSQPKLKIPELTVRPGWQSKQFTIRQTYP